MKKTENVMWWMFFLPCFFMLVIGFAVASVSALKYLREKSEDPRLYINVEAPGFQYEHNIVLPEEKESGK